MKKILTLILLLTLFAGVGCEHRLGRTITDFKMGKDKLIKENKPIEAIDYLEKALKKEGEKVRTRCYLVIAYRRAEDDEVTKIRGDKQEYVAKGQQHLTALKTAANQAVEALLDILTDREAGRIRKDSMQVIVILGAPAATPLVDAYIEFAKTKYVREGYRGIHREIIEMLTDMGSDAIPSLAKALEDQNNPIFVRREIARILGDIGNADAQKYLAGQINATDGGLKMEATIALYKIGNKQYATTIIAGLNDPDVSARRATARALITMNESPTDKLIEALNDCDPQVRTYAAKALGKHPKKQAIEPLVKAIKRESYKITEQSLANLKSEGMPVLDVVPEEVATKLQKKDLQRLQKQTLQKLQDEVLAKLHGLKNQPATGKEEFLRTLKETLGSEQTDKLQSWILKHAGENEAFKNSVADALTEIGAEHGKYIVNVLVKELGVITGWKVRIRVVDVLSNLIDYFDQNTAYLLYEHYQNKEDNPTVKDAIDKLLKKLEDKGI